MGVPESSHFQYDDPTFQHREAAGPDLQREIGIAVRGPVSSAFRLLRLHIDQKVRQATLPGYRKLEGAKNNCMLAPIDAHPV